MQRLSVNQGEIQSLEQFKALFPNGGPMSFRKYARCSGEFRGTEVLPSGLQASISSRNALLYLVFRERPLTKYLPKIKQSRFYGLKNKKGLQTIVIKWLKL